MLCEKDYLLSSDSCSDPEASCFGDASSSDSASSLLAARVVESGVSVVGEDLSIGDRELSFVGVAGCLTLESGVYLIAVVTGFSRDDCRLAGSEAST
jgi:hypothetical protein